MGKLHTLRRAIERNPEKWYWRPAFAPEHIRVYGARKQGDSWEPLHYVWFNAPYKAFVKHVLKELREVGIAD